MMTAIDFGKTSSDYGRYRAGFPPELFTRLAAFGVGLAGQHVLDLGTGTGTLARGFAGQGCVVVSGLDPSLSMLAEARRLDTGAPWPVAYLCGRAEAVPLGAGRLDGVAAGQCWHWFDRPRAAAEVRRVLKPGGWLLIAHFDWLPLPGSMVEATERLILTYNPAWRGAGGTGIHAAWLTDAAAAGFAAIESFTFDVDTPYSHAAWRGRVRASAGVAASLPPDQVAAFDAALRDLLAAHFPADPLAVPHRVFAMIARKSAC